jgi:O-antigen ligase
MAASDRLFTIFDRGTFEGEDGSLNWRRTENEYAITTIKSNLWVGLGFGFMYRPWDPSIDRPDPGGLRYDFRRHIHNGHFWILLQSGLLGYLSLVWLSIAFLIRGFKNWRSIPDNKLKSVALGFTLSYLVVLAAAITNSTFTQWRWIPLLGIMMGVTEVILMKSIKNTDNLNST